MTILKDDPIVEYEDEFGRLRTARRSDIPRNLLPDNQEEADSDEYVVFTLRQWTQLFILFSET